MMCEQCRNMFQFFASVCTLLLMCLHALIYMYLVLCPSCSLTGDQCLVFLMQDELSDIVLTDMEHEQLLSFVERLDAIGEV